MAQIFVEPESRQGRALQREYQAEGLASLPLEGIRDQVEALAFAFERKAVDSELFALSQSVVEKLAGAATDETPTDSRVAHAIARLRADMDGDVSLAGSAAAVGLSPDRFRHLFMAETGVAFRPYILWLRLEQALGSYVKGNSLTEAALVAGFSDSAHFSRTFRRMFGIAPVSVRPE
ncbi:MAG: AraC family transcriptional regulator [Pseudomonadota bacterium]